MYETRLLERIRSHEEESSRRGGNDQRRAVDSILTHLQRMLNTRQGNVPIADDYGVPDFLDFLQNYPDSVHQVEESIENAIRKYEPRLSGAQVTFVPQEDDSLTLRFHILAHLTTNAGERVVFETVVDADGKVTVRR